MSQNLELVFMDSDDLYKRFDLSQLVQFLRNERFEVGDIKVGKRIVPIGFSDLFTPNVIQLIDQAKEAFFLSFNPAWNLEITTAIGWGRKNFGATNRIWISISTGNTPYFWRSEYHPDQYSDFFIDFAKRIYNLFYPTYGWIDFESGYPEFIEIEQRKLSAIYWANFFGPPFVEKIGKEKLLNSPMRSVEVLPNGGVFCTLSSCPGLTYDHVDVGVVSNYFDGIRVR